MTIEESGSICVTKNTSSLGGTPSHTAAAEGYHDKVMSSDSEPDGFPLDDTDTSSEKERPPGQLASRIPVLWLPLWTSSSHTPAV